CGVSSGVRSRRGSAFGSGSFTSSCTSMPCAISTVPSCAKLLLIWVATSSENAPTFVIFVNCGIRDTSLRNVDAPIGDRHRHPRAVLRFEGQEAAEGKVGNHTGGVAAKSGRVVQTRHAAGHVDDRQ